MNSREANASAAVNPSKTSFSGSPVLPDHGRGTMSAQPEARRPRPMSTPAPDPRPASARPPATPRLSGLPEPDAPAWATKADDETRRLRRVVRELVDACPGDGLRGLAE